MSEAVSTPVPAEKGYGEFASRRRWFLWHLVCLVMTATVRPLYRVRMHHRERVPRTGPTLYLTNHQSFYDPLLIGYTVSPRPCHFLARSSLWKHRWLAPFITGLNAVPVERGVADMKAMRTCIEVLKKGHALNIFPEGTRTADGEIGDFATGTMLLVKRARPTVVPICIEGAFDIWPRQRKWPRLRGTADIMIGKPVPYDAIADLPPEQALDQFRRAMIQMQRELREIRKK